MATRRSARARRRAAGTGGVRSSAVNTLQRARRWIPICLPRSWKASRVSPRHAAAARRVGIRPPQPASTSRGTRCSSDAPGGCDEGVPLAGADRHAANALARSSISALGAGEACVLRSRRDDGLLRTPLCLRRSASAKLGRHQPASRAGNAQQPVTNSAPGGERQTPRNSSSRTVAWTDAPSRGSRHARASNPDSQVAISTAHTGELGRKRTASPRAAASAPGAARADDRSTPPAAC